jgi:hypothetical protein
MIQCGLDFERVERAERADTQAQHLARVSDALAPRIVAWALERIGQEFHADELREAVGGAPASADRVLRDLRRRGVVGYACKSRRASLYVIRFVRPELLDAPLPEQPDRMRERRARLLEQIAQIDAALRAAEGEAA